MEKGPQNGQQIKFKVLRPHATATQPQHGYYSPAALCRKRTPESAHHFYVKSCGFTDCPTSKVSGVGIEMAQL